MNTKQKIIEFIDKSFIEMESCGEDDLNIIEGIESDVMKMIMRYAYDNKMQIPGYDLNEIYAFIDRDTESDDYCPDDEDFDIVIICCEIAEQIRFEGLQVPADFEEILMYFNKKFYPLSFD